MADEFFDDAYTFKIDGSTGSLTYDGTLDFFDAYQLSAFFALSNITASGLPDQPDRPASPARPGAPSLAVMPLPASLPLLGAGLAGLWLIRSKIRKV